MPTRTPPAQGDANAPGNTSSKDGDAKKNANPAPTDATKKKPQQEGKPDSSAPVAPLDPYAPWGTAPPSDDGPYGQQPQTPSADAAVPQTTPEVEKGYTPLPEGKVLPPDDPPPKPVPPPIDDIDRPDPAGLARPQFPQLLAFPLQVISGVIAGIGMVPVSALTLGLGICAGPAAIALAEVSFADLVGQKRGTLFWPTIAAYGTSATCTTVYAAASGLAIGLVLTGVVSFAAISPALLISGVLITPLALFPAFVAANIVATAFAPAIMYPFTSEPKNADDPELHFPGFFSPNHRAPRAPPGTPKAAMRF